MKTLTLEEIIKAVIIIGILLFIIFQAVSDDNKEVSITVYTNGIPLEDGDELIVRKHITTKMRYVPSAKCSLPYSDVEIYAVRKSDVTVSKTVQE